MSEQVATVTSLNPPAEVAPEWLAGSRTRWDRVWTAARFGTDLLSLVAAAALSGAASSGALGIPGTVAAIAGSLLVFAGGGLYAPRIRIDLLAELRRLLAGSALVFTAVAGVLLIDPRRVGAGDAAVITWLVSGTLLSISRLGVSAGQRYARRREWASSPTLIVGAGRIGALTAQRLLDEPGLGLRPIGFLDKEPLDDAGDGRVAALPVLGASWDLEHVVATHRVDQIVIAFSTAPHDVLVDLVRRCWALGVNVLVVPRLFEVEGRRMRVEHIGALPLVALSTSDPRGTAFTLKYALDRVIALFALIALSPVLLAAALAVLVSTGRPVLFRQQRIGRDGHPFEILKFRTMRGKPEADGDANARWAEWILTGNGMEPPQPPVEADRRTGVGAFLRRCSLDELPQLWNVVRGDMSLVGPRPEIPRFVSQFEYAIKRYPDRHRVKSGLTGWAQVHGLRGDTSLTDRIEWDNFYIENWSPWLDLKIVLRTIPSLIGRGGEGRPPVAEPGVSGAFDAPPCIDEERRAAER